MLFLVKIKNYIANKFRKKQKNDEILLEVHKNGGILWDKIAKFKEQLMDVPNSVSHKAGEEQSVDMKELFPLKHNIEGGLYTREVFMPKGSVVVSFIHKQDHPSFVLEGDASVLLDDGKIIRHKQGDKIMTKAGTQRVLFLHEDTRWCCVYRTDAKTIEEAEMDVYTENWRELPSEIIDKNRLLCQV
jgi:hypothetical protein